MSELDSGPVPSLNDLRLSVQSALLGAVTPNLRLVTTGLSGTNIQLRAYYDGAPSEDDEEEMSYVGTLLIADYPDLAIFIEVIRSDWPQKIDDPNSWVYNRKEEPS